MKTMTIRETSRGRKTTVNARQTYQNATGEWIVEMDKTDYRRACSFVCQGVKNCVWQNLDIQADLDDDGKKYKVVTM